MHLLDVCVHICVWGIYMSIFFLPFCLDSASWFFSGVVFKSTSRFFLPSTVYKSSYPRPAPFNSSFSETSHSIPPLLPSLWKEESSVWTRSQETRECHNAQKSANTFILQQVGRRPPVANQFYWRQRTFHD